MTENLENSKIIIHAPGGRKIFSLSREQMEILLSLPEEGAREFESSLHSLIARSGGSQAAKMDEITKINLAILDLHGAEANEIGDGYHTFGELYNHRVTLFMALCHRLPVAQVWKSHAHSDGSIWAGWFIAGINTAPGQQISYHLPEKKWDMLRVPELLTAPEYDGHTSDQVIERLERILLPVDDSPEAKPLLSYIGQALGMTAAESVALAIDPEINTWDDLVAKLEKWLSHARALASQAPKGNEIW